MNFGPAHGAWCGARTWPTSCPSCSADVFFFMCNCGSKVFFDSLGDPWPRHDCHTSWTRSLPRTTSSKGVTVHLSPGVSVTRPNASFRVASFEDHRERRPSRRREAITAIKPLRGASKEVIGVLRELTRSMSIISTLRLDETSMTYAMLGSMGAQPLGRITAHVPSDPGYFESYTAWIPTELVEDPRIKRGTTVSLLIKAVDLPKTNRAWFCDDFQVVG